MKYYVTIHIDKVLHFEVDADSKEEAIDEVYYGETEPYDEDIIDSKVDECCPVETEVKDISTYTGFGEEDTPLEGCALF